MIRWEEIYNVVVAMAPLYVALILGYGSVKWWRLITTSEQCDAINRMVCYFTLPLFTFEFAAHIDPFEMNYRFLAGDAIAKVLIVVILAIWAKCSSKEKYCWSITSFSLSTLTNSLVVGIPLLKPMYGQMGVDLVVQFSVVQAIVWLTLLLFLLEFRRSGIHCSSPKVVGRDNSKELSGDAQKDLEGNIVEVTGRPSFCYLMKIVWMKLASNPNVYGCVAGITWAFISNRWHFPMPSIMEGSILIMSKAGTGTAMFSMGLFMASQEKVIACGTSLTLYAMVLKFIAGPLAAAFGAIVVGLRGDVLRVVIIQAALPQSITSFIFAKEYGLHADVLSTAVIFGMMVSLPVLIGYYAVLELVH